MKTIGGLALLAAVGIGVALQRCEVTDFFICEIRADGSWSLKGTVNTTGNARPYLELDAKDELPPVQPGDGVMIIRVSHRILPVGFKTWKVERGGTSLEYSSGKAGYRAVVWGLTLAPVVLGVFGFAALVGVGKRVTP